MRLDQHLSTYFDLSRNRARQLIDQGLVQVNKVIVLKPSFKVQSDDEIVYKLDHSWVSRGAFKLIAALDHWDVSVRGKIAIDVGASTGGFTQVLLDRDVKKVFAVDVGTAQLAQIIADDERVVNLEKQDIRTLNRTHVPENIDLIVGDVSFISLVLIVPGLIEMFSDASMMIFLLKPQFEVGPSGRNKKGVVTDLKLHDLCKKKVKTVFKEVGFKQIEIINSPLEGGSGNQEYLIKGCK